MESIKDMLIVIGHTVAEGEEGKFKNVQGRIERYTYKEVMEMTGISIATLWREKSKKDKKS